METQTHEWYTAYMSRGGMAHNVTIKAWDAKDARYSAEDMYPGWRVNDVVKQDD